MKDNRFNNAAQSGDQGEGRDQGYDQEDDGKTTKQRRKEPPGAGVTTG